MPELPEVETIRRDLTKKIIGKRIVAVTAGDPRVIKEPAATVFIRQLKGETVQAIIRRAKLLVIQFKADKFLIIHLRLTGWLLYPKPDVKARVQFKFSDGTCLNYMDSRLLGELRLRKTWQDLKFVQELGPEPFDLKAEEFCRMLKGKTTKIKPLLLDQTFIAGIGNIYAQESLFMARIDPRRPARSLKNSECLKLHQAIVDVLNAGIKNRGSSVDDYRDTNGEAGGMEKLLKVYGREGQPCVICRKPMTKIQLAGRGTCFCSNCQK